MPEFPINRELKDIALLEWKEAFIYMLLEMYKDYKVHGLKEPEEVMNFTLNYQKENDKIMEFLDEHIKETKDKKDVIKKRPLCRTYMEWFREEVGGKPLASFKKHLYGKMTKKTGMVYKNGWFGYRIKGDDDDEDDGLD